MRDKVFIGPGIFNLRLMHCSFQYSKEVVPNIFFSGIFLFFIPLFLFSYILEDVTE